MVSHMLVLMCQRQIGKPCPDSHDTELSRGEEGLVARNDCSGCHGMESCIGLCE